MIPTRSLRIVTPLDRWRENEAAGRDGALPGRVRRAELVAVASPAVAAATAAVLLRLGLVDAEGAAVVLAAVEGAHRLLGVAVGHLDEAEALRGAGVAIGDDARGVDAAVGLEEGAEGAVVHGIGQIADVEFHSDSCGRRSP